MIGVHMSASKRLNNLIEAAIYWWERGLLPTKDQIAETAHTNLSTHLANRLKDEMGGRWEHRDGAYRLVPVRQDEASASSA